MENPSLVEYGFKSFLNESLRKCNKVKQEYKNNIYNIGLFIFLVFCIFLFLFIKFKGKLTTEEMKENEIKKQQYILSRIKNYQDDKRRSSQKLISGLAHWENEYDNIYKPV